MIQKKNKIKNKIKPVELDAHFRYKCPDIDCGYDHWLSLKEVQTKNFRVVCDCGFVFRPRLIKLLKIVYCKKKSKENSIDKTSERQNDNVVVKTAIEVVDQPIPQLDDKTLNDCIKIMIGYGFTKTESMELIQKSYCSIKSKDIGSLVKNALLIIGGSSSE